MENKHCYYYKYIKQKNGIFENIVDAVFILLMENSKREHDIFKQLDKYNLHSNVIIQYNKGFNLCKKKLLKNYTHYDLMDANFQVFNYSIEKNYNNILILEDDFIITKNIYKKEYVNAISNFVKNKDYNVLSLGAFPYIKQCFGKYISKCFYITCAQAIIYNKKYFQIFKNRIKKYKHVDDFKNVSKLYMTNIPIIIQPFPITENMKNWSSYAQNCFIILNKILNINWNGNYKGKELEYWNRYYCFLNILNIILYLIIIIVFIIFVYTLFMLNQNPKNII